MAASASGGLALLGEVALARPRRSVAWRSSSSIRRAPALDRTVLPVFDNASQQFQKAGVVGGTEGLADLLEVAHHPVRRRWRREPAEASLKGTGSMNPD